MQNTLSDYQNIWFLSGVCFYIMLICFCLWFDYSYKRHLALSPKMYRDEIRGSVLQKIKDDIYRQSFILLIFCGIAMYYTADIPYASWCIVVMTYYNPFTYNLYENFKVFNENIKAFKRVRGKQ